MGMKLLGKFHGSSLCIPYNVETSKPRVLALNSLHLQHPPQSYQTNPITMSYNSNLDESRRIYNPSEDPYSRQVPPHQLVVYNTNKHICQLQMQLHPTTAPFPDTRSLVVFIDDACRGNSTPSARASYGVYFGPRSPYNVYGLLPSTLPQTSTHAEIEALSHALAIVDDITRHDHMLTSIKFATDSVFLVNAMGVWMEQWIENRGIGSNGRGGGAL